MTAPIGPATIMTLLRGGPAPNALADTEDSAPTLLRLGGLSFDDAVREALQHHGEFSDGSSVTEETNHSPVGSAETPTRAHLPSEETATIAREADRTGIDPALLVALRRTENGRPGREFGVLSVAADGQEAQARVAANTVRNTILRFERGGGVTVDPATNRYSEAFLRFLSSRYAPIGAANDPAGLNRHHAPNLIALYRKVSDGNG
jgi:hypothetical protein